MNDKDADKKRQQNTENINICEIKQIHDKIMHDQSAVTKPDTAVSASAITRDITASSRAAYYQRKVKLRHKYEPKQVVNEPLSDLMTALENDKNFDKVAHTKENMIKSIISERTKEMTTHNPDLTKSQSTLDMFRSTSKKLAKSRTSSNLTTCSISQQHGFKFGSMVDKISELKNANKSKLDTSAAKSCTSRVSSKSKNQAYKVSSKARKFAKKLAVKKSINLGCSPSLKTSTKVSYATLKSKNGSKTRPKVDPSDFYQRSIEWKSNRENKIRLKQVNLTTRMPPNESLKSIFYLLKFIS